MSDLDRLLQQVEELKRLAMRPDDSWMDNMSNEELRALGQRVRKVADGLSGLQGQLQRKAPSNPMKPIIAKRSAPPPAAAPQPRQDPFSARQANEGADLSNPMQRRRHAPPREAPSGAPRPQAPAPDRQAGH